MWLEPPTNTLRGKPTVAADTKGLSLNEIRNRVAKFVVDYKDATNEKQNTNDFWRALMRCYGVEDSYLLGVTFEYEARRSDTGGRGYIDVFLPGKYLIEQKTKGKIIRPKGAEKSNAETQAEAYLTGGTITNAQMPRYVVTSDFATIQVTDLKASRQSPVRTKTIGTADLVDHVELLLFLTGRDAEDVIAQDQAEASVAAARLMGDLYAALTGDADTDGTDIEEPDEEDETTMEASVLLTRLLFLMFGDDAGLWEKGLFGKFVATRTSPDGSDLGAQLAALFNVLDTPDRRRDKRTDEALLAFPHVNGAIFDHDDTKMMWFDSGMREALLAACEFDWSRISPAVFGSLFQTVKSKAARREGGEHYTSEDNILKVLRPMFLDDLRTRLDAANTKPALEALHEEFKHLRYVDPACGCGNFLIVAYREMRALELDLLVKLQTKRGKDADLILDPSDMLNVRLDQFYGIELNWWPAKIAETAMFLVDHQANQQMAKTLGYTPNRLPIDISANIHHANAMSADWATLLPGIGPTVYVFGNPPFVGHKERSAAQTTELKSAWGKARYNGYLDYVTGWHAKTLDYLDDKDGDFAFVTTNSVVQGEAVTALFDASADRGWSIAFAHRTFQWTSESVSKERAAVHCVIVGFTRRSLTRRTLFSYPAITAAPVPERSTEAISRYLILHEDVAVRSRKTVLAPNLPRMSLGSIPYDWGFLMVTPDEFDVVAADQVAAKYLRRYINGKEIINNLVRHCLWLEHLDPKDLQRSPLLRARIDAVADKRRNSNDRATQVLAQTPHLMRPNPNRPTVPYLAVPGVFAEQRLFATGDHFEPDVIAGGKAYTCPDPDGFAFAIFSSSMFITWQKTVGGRIKSDPSFSTDIVWNNLPLPDVPAVLRSQIVQAGKDVLEVRASRPDQSLADLYHSLAMPADLVKAHRALDKVVDKAFGAPRGTHTEEQRQKVLFARYAELAAS
jgi:hypothetical protein